MARDHSHRTDGGFAAIGGEQRDDVDEPDADRGGEGTGASEFAGEDLVVGYPATDAPVIDGASIRLAPGEVTALVGPNGSGKSTLLKGLARQVAPEAGTAYLDGTDVRSFGSKEFARQLGLLTQENVSPEGISVEELVGHGRYPHQGFLEPRSEADRAAIERAMALAGVEHLRDRELRNLSGGQKQLVWIAMALAQETDVLLLDEPTTFLDLRHQLQVMGIVETLRDESEVTVGLVLHDLEQAARYADRLVALCEGAVYDAGPPRAIVTEDLLADVFGIEATVEPGAEGPRITPLASTDEAGVGSTPGAGADAGTGGGQAHAGETSACGTHVDEDQASAAQYGDVGDATGDTTDPTR